MDATHRGVSCGNAAPAKQESLVLPAILLLGLFVRLIGLGTHSYWFDEALEINRALTPLPDLLFLSEGPDPPLYRLILAVMLLFSRNEVVTRLPSVMFSVFTVSLTYHWLKLAKHRRLGYVAAFLLAIAPVSIYYAQEVSQYSLALCLTGLLLVAFERIRSGDRLSDWLLLWLWTVLALYTYYGLAWLLPVLVLDLGLCLWRARRYTGLSALGAYLLACAAGIIPLYSFYIRPQYIWMSRVSLNPYFSGLNLGQIVKGFADRLYSDVVRFQLLTFSSGTTDWIAITLGIWMIVGCGLIWKCLPSLRRLVILAPLILVVFYIASGLGYFHFGHRYALPVLPFLMLFLAVPLQQLAEWHGRASVLAGSILCLSSIAFWPQTHLISNPLLALPREELRPVTQFLEQKASPTDVVYVYYGANPAFRVYDPLPDHQILYGRWLRHLPSVDMGPAVLEAVGTPKRFWVVFSHIHEDEGDAITDGILDAEAGYQLGFSYAAQGAAAVQFVRVP